MVAKREVITKAQQFQLANWLNLHKVQLNGWELSAAAERARKELKFSFTDRTFKLISTHCGAGIKFAGSDKHSPMSVIFRKIERLEMAYGELCKQLGIDPLPEVQDSDNQV